MGNAKIQQVNARLKRGEGEIGYRTSKGSNGEKLPSKFLYFAFYQGWQAKVCQFQNQRSGRGLPPTARCSTSE
jgi:hypothetical protein